MREREKKKIKVDKDKVDGVSTMSARAVVKVFQQTLISVPCST